jgi:hypothetical protein
VQLRNRQCKLKDLIVPVQDDANMAQDRRIVRIFLHEHTGFNGVIGLLSDIRLPTKRLLLRNTGDDVLDWLNPDLYDSGHDKVILQLRFRNQSSEELILRSMSLDSRWYQFVSKFVDF